MSNATDVSISADSRYIKGSYCTPRNYFQNQNSAASTGLGKWVHKYVLFAISSDPLICIIGKRVTLDTAMETELVGHILLLDYKVFAMTLNAIRELVFKFAQKNNLTHRFNKDKTKAGYVWVYSFLERHPNVSIRKVQGLCYACSRCLNRDEVRKCFDNLQKMYDALNLWEEPVRILNADETGLQLIFKPDKVISCKGKKDVNHNTTEEKGSTVTAMVCSSATGSAILPFVKMKGFRQKSSYSKGLPNGSTLEMSDSGYMTSEVFNKFLDHLNKHKPQGKILLIIDGHAKIRIHCIKRQCSELRCYASLPLDVSYFKSLKHFNNEACKNFV
ncbi:uncharacterized protein LOC118190721 [Stegodyphus dumicola]|uniref:uncharacterized protein LOC118190721 n=1 Tax=Stegodyphus dumicola TaxID=202533 RepID=UPI0015B0DAB6|nr:uncharacterized protein LOC118190721 [Stegodyphus dumicola]